MKKHVQVNQFAKMGRRFELIPALLQTTFTDSLEYKALYGDAMRVSLSGAQMWPPETNRISVFEFSD